MVFVEIKLDDLDIIDLPDGFSYVTKNRKGVTKNSGGIAIYILKQYISFIESEGQYVQWFKFQKCLLNCEKDVLFGAVFKPLANSKYTNTDALEEIENELLTFADKFDAYVSLIGDFNAKTGTREDFIVPDESLIGIFEIESSNCRKYSGKMLNFSTQLFRYIILLSMVNLDTVRSVYMTL